MAKDLDRTASASGLDSPAHRMRNEALTRLLQAWHSRNARAGRRVGSFALMAAGLAACGGSGNGTDGNPGDGAPPRQWR